MNREIRVTPQQRAVQLLGAKAFIADPRQRHIGYQVYERLENDQVRLHARGGSGKRRPDEASRPEGELASACCDSYPSLAHHWDWAPSTMRLTSSRIALARPRSGASLSGRKFP